MSSWKDFITASLLGSERATQPALPDALASIIGEISALPAESQFLLRSGAMAWWRRAGWKPGTNATTISTANSDTPPTLSPTSLTHLWFMLHGRFAAVLPEWLRAVADASRQVPPEYLPALLTRAKQERALRPLVLAAGGERALWLGTQNPEWAFAASDAEEYWETGNREQRIRILRAMRESDPAAARAKVEAVWKEESADLRAAFLAEFLAKLSDADSAFLESILDDRSKEARRLAIDLLSRLPASPFVARMIERATPLLTWNRGGLLSRASLEVILPPDPDAASKRDGLDSKAFGTQKALGEKAVLLVLILSAVPLSHWTDTFQQSPSALLKAAEKSEFSRAVVTGWTWATLRQRDATWAEAILDAPAEPHFEFLPSEPLMALLPESTRAERFTAAIRSGALKATDNARWHAFAGQLLALPGMWPLGLAREVVGALRSHAAHGIPWHFRSTVESLLLRIPPALLSEAAINWPTDQEGVPGMIEFLSFRHEALLALSQS